MFETAGTLTIVELTSSLLALVLLPLLWSAIAAVAAVRRTGGALAVRVAIAAAGGTFALALMHAVRIAQLPVGHVAQQHVATFARLGQLELTIDLVCGPTSAACALLVSFLGLAAVLHAVWVGKGHLPGRLAWKGLVTGAVMLVVLADGLLALAIGLALTSLAGWALAGGGRPRMLALTLAADTALVVAASILFWSLGGSFGSSGFTADPEPRFSLVAVGEPQPAESKAFVSLTTYEGALVTADDGPPLPGEPIRAPFTLALEPGTYSFRIQAGAATQDMLVTHVTLAAGRAYVLSPYGPTMSMRNLADQLAVPRPMLGGTSSMRAALAARSMMGVPITAIVGFAVVLSALLRLAWMGRMARAGLAYALEAVVPIVLAFHVATLLNPWTSAVLAIAPAVIAVILAADAASAKSRGHVPRAALAALAALAVASILLGETAGAMVLLVSGTLGAAGATAGIDDDADVRWLGVACGSVAGVLPGTGASPGIASAIAGAFGVSAAGRWPGAVIAPLATITAMLLSLAVFRVYGASIRAQNAAPPSPRGSSALVKVLAGGSLLAGAALGVGTSPFGGEALPLARRLVASPGGLDGAARIMLAAVGAALAAAVIGLVAARRATRTAAEPEWIALLGAPASLVAKATRRIASTVGFLANSVTIMNEDVIDDATEVAASLVPAAGRTLRRLDATAVGRLVARLFGRAPDDAAMRSVEGDSPGFERLRVALVLGMVALLGLVVLSSVLLG